jgi:signal transduction histidine kinase
MINTELLSRIRESCIESLSKELAHAEEVRESFKLELRRFFDLLEQSILMGDPAWLDTVLLEWIKSATQQGFLGQGNTILRILDRIFITIFQKARESLSPEEAVELLGNMLLPYSHSLAYSTELVSQQYIDSLQKDLEAAQKSIAKFDQSKSDFVNVTAHELRTPLTLIEGYAAMLQEMPGVNPQSMRIITGLVTGTKRLREIIDDMIDVSLIENGLLRLSYQPVWINRLIRMIADDFSSALESRKQHLEIKEFDGSNEPYYYDGERLYEALTKIFSNAIKYTPDGGRILIAGRKLTGFIEVTLMDSGIGIDPEDQTQIFKKFGRIGKADLHSSGKVKYKGGGPGLGLTIAKGIIEAHGGSIWVESPGYDEEQFPGATFHVLLPQHKDPP